MTFTASSQGASATPASTFATTLDTLLQAGGWTFVETWTSSTFTAAIYKSPAASNGVGDYYIAVNRSSDASTTVYLTLAEVWNSGAKTFGKYAPSAGNLTPAADFAVSTTKAPNDGALYNNGLVILSAAGFQYWASINAYGVHLATRVSATDYAAFAGLYDDLLDVSISPFPLLAANTTIAWGVNYVQTNAGMATREPGVTVAHSYNFAAGLYSSAWTPTNAQVDTYLGKYAAGRAAIITGRNDTGQGGYRGLFKSALRTSLSGAVNGDTLTIGAATYCHFGGLWVDESV